MPQKLVSKVFRVTRQHINRKHNGDLLRRDTTNEKGMIHINRFQHELEFCIKLNKGYCHIEGKLFNVIDLNEIGSEWINLISNDLRKLFVTKLMNIKQFYIADLSILLPRTPSYNRYLMNKDQYQCMIIFGWCYDNSIFVWHDFMH